MRYKRNGTKGKKALAKMNKLSVNNNSGSLGFVQSQKDQEKIEYFERRKLSRGGK